MQIKKFVEKVKREIEKSYMKNLNTPFFRVLFGIAGLFIFWGIFFSHGIIPTFLIFLLIFIPLVDLVIAKKLSASGNKNLFSEIVKINLLIGMIPVIVISLVLGFVLLSIFLGDKEAGWAGAPAFILLSLYVFFGLPLIILLSSIFCWLYKRVARLTKFIDKVKMEIEKKK
jgi:hypothetical protein